MEGTESMFSKMKQNHLKWLKVQKVLTDSEQSFLS
jgi:hypothetical protein